MNLLSNAIKFTERGGVSISAKLVEDNKHSKRERPESSSVVVEFAVEDTGIGIAEEVAAKLFEPFSQAIDNHFRIHHDFHDDQVPGLWQVRNCNTPPSVKHQLDILVEFIELLAAWIS